ncbi:MAG: RNA polymerase sigma-70 factor [Chitinophagaceae bacterium]
MLVNTHRNNDHLLKLVALGDEKAFRLLFNQYWDNIYAVAFRFIKSRVIAEEIVQDVFVKLWTNKEKLDSIENFDNYIFIIARNHIYNHLRQSPLQIAPMAEVADVSSNPETDLYYKETNSILARAVENLPGQQRIIFNMSRGEGLDYTTIAKKLQLSRFTVKTHMHKAIQSIKVYLARHNGTFFLLLLLVYWLH